jgi:hypothetical protein
MKRVIFFILACFAIVFSLTAGDILVLKNGMRFQGEIKRFYDCSLLFRTDIGEFIIPAGDIQTVEFEKPSKRFMKRYSHMSSERCYQGRMDATKYHGKEFGHLLMGFFFGPFALIGTAIARQTPQKGSRTLSKSDNQQLFDDPDYLRCYQRKAKGDLLTMEAIGWAQWLVVGLILFLANI